MPRIHSRTRQSDPLRRLKNTKPPTPPERPYKDRAAVEVAKTFEQRIQLIHPPRRGADATAKVSPASQPSPPAVNAACTEVHETTSVSGLTFIARGQRGSACLLYNQKTLSPFRVGHRRRICRAPLAHARKRMPAHFLAGADSTCSQMERDQRSGRAGAGASLSTA
jgi:hypothetical protein